MVYKLEPLKDFILPPRSKLTLELEGHFSKKCHNLPKNIDEKDLQRYLEYYISYRYFKTSKVLILASRVKGQFDVKLRKKLDIDI